MIAASKVRGLGGRALALALAASLLSGCAVLGSLAPPPRTFDLTAPDLDGKVAGRTGAQLLIPRPVALQVLDSRRIAVRSSPATLEYFAGSQWADELPDLVQARLIEAFQQGGRARGVGRPGDSLLVDYQIQIELRAFEYVATARAARVALSARILDDRTGRVVGTGVFEDVVPVTGDNAGHAVIGLGAAFDKVALRLVSWVLARI